VVGQSARKAIRAKLIYYNKQNIRTVRHVDSVPQFPYSPGRANPLFSDVASVMVAFCELF
jgi:hypothetical protein